MSHIFVRSERVIDARPEEVFQALADYQTRRPRILPPNYLDYAVERGGQGGGTVIRYRFQAAGRERPYQMEVEETIKGKVLTERDRGSSLVTRWSVLPLENGRKSKVSVESDWQGGRGIGGFFESTFAPLGLKRIYKNVLLALALLIQSPTPRQELLTGDRQWTRSRTGLYLTLAGSVLVLLVGIKYLRGRLS
jgi:uncharacterized protein YndB with AHSA1/START domain